MSSTTEMVVVGIIVGLLAIGVLVVFVLNAIKPDLLNADPNLYRPQWPQPRRNSAEAATSAVRTYSGTLEKLPPEVAGLGEPERILSPSSLVSLAAVAGPPRPTYLWYRDALVLFYADEFTVIPFDSISEYVAALPAGAGRGQSGIGVTTGERFRLNPNIQDAPYLHEKLQRVIGEQVLPQAVRSLKSGEPVLFVPFLTNRRGAWWWAMLQDPINRPLYATLSVSREGITYDGRSLPLPELTGLKVLDFRKPGGSLVQRDLVIEKAGGREWCRIDVNTAPNSEVLLSLLKCACPPGSWKTGG